VHLLQLNGGAYSDGLTWNNGSDRSAKMNFADVDPREVLAKVAALPIETWNYKTQDASIRHLGPMAQDFAAAFGPGADDTHISTVDSEGVALAAIQGLYQIVQEQQAEIAQLKTELTASGQAAQQVEITQLKAELAASEQATQPRAQLCPMPGLWPVAREREHWVQAASRLAAQPDSLLPLLVGLSLLMNQLLGVVLVVHLRHGGRP
jgi:hypothetical protein